MQRRRGQVLVRSPDYPSPRPRRSAARGAAAFARSVKIATSRVRPFPQPPPHRPRAPCRTVAWSEVKKERPAARPGSGDMSALHRAGAARMLKTPQWVFQSTEPQSKCSPQSDKPTTALRTESSPCSTICAFHSGVSV